MGFEDDVCNTGLGLALGCRVSDHQAAKKKKLSLKNDPMFFPSLTLGPSDVTYQSISKIDAVNKVQGDHQSTNDVHHQQAQALSSLSAVSSFSNSSVKKEIRDFGGEQEEDDQLERISSRISDEDEEASPRKKLRLTKEQSAILEDSFKEHSTLNPKQKQALADKLNLRPRQVEVWFQNRRARTKLKQTEVDCELLKKCCETLTEENKRLQKELQELKSLKLTTTPFYMQLPAATLTMCPSCERVATGGEGSPASPFTMGQKSSHFYNPFTHPSAAC